MTERLQEKKLEYQPRIDAALERLGELAGGGPPFGLALVPSDTALDAAVTADSSWAEGLLYMSVAEYLEQLVQNLSALPAAATALGAAAPARVVQFSIEPEGGCTTAASALRGGRLDLVFRAESLKTNQSGWTDIGLDLPDALRSASAGGAVDAAAGPAPALDPTGEAAPPETAAAEGLADDLASRLAGKQAAIDGRLAALTEFVGDGRAWRFELSGDPTTMDAEVAREASYMKGSLYDTVEEFLGFIVHNVRRVSSPEELALASPERTIVFAFVDIEACPRRYTGAFQAVMLEGRLHFVGPAGDFKSNGGGASDIGSDLDKALMSARGETGPTERERRLAESLAAIAATSASRDAAPEGRACRMCKSTGFNTCNACHGKGSGCNVCKGSGRSRSKCSSCGGVGTK